MRCSRVTRSARSVHRRCALAVSGGLGLLLGLPNRFLGFLLALLGLDGLQLLAAVGTENVLLRIVESAFRADVYPHHVFRNYFMFDIFHLFLAAASPGELLFYLIELVLVFLGLFLFFLDFLEGRLRALAENGCMVCWTICGFSSL